MAKLGFFKVDIKEIHFDWEKERNGRIREVGEGYIGIPIADAQKLEIYNSGYLGGKDILGGNLFYAIFSDGFGTGTEILLKASGNSGIGTTNYKYAKNLHGAGDLKLIKNWFDYNKIDINNLPQKQVKVTIIKKDTIQLEII